MRRNELPDFCLSTIPSTGQLIILKKGVRGYYASGWDTGNREENQNIAQSHNRRRGISDIQEAAMSAGSMFGWSLPGADPQWYLDNARYVNAIMAKGHIKDPVMSIYYPVDDFLLRYEVLGEAKCICRYRRFRKSCWVRSHSLSCSRIWSAVCLPCR